MTVITEVTEFRIGRVINRTFAVIGRNAVTFLIVSVPAMLPQLAMNLHFGTYGFFKTDTLENGALTGLSQIIAFVCPCFVMAALVPVTSADILGRKTKLKDVFVAGIVQFLPVLVISIATWLLFTLGMWFLQSLSSLETSRFYWLYYLLGVVLFIVPGFFLFTIWAVAVSARIVEGVSLVGSFKRSARLTKGHRWKILALVIGYFIVSNLLIWSATPADEFNLFPNETGTNSILYIVLVWAVLVSMGLWGTVSGTVIYYELRTLKEGASPDQLAEAFD